MVMLSWMKAHLEPWEGSITTLLWHSWHDLLSRERVCRAQQQASDVDVS